MAPRKRARYRVIVAPIGTIVLDRLAKTWTVRDRVDPSLIVDYGHISRADWTAYLPNRIAR
jgi:hypothetical protein